LQEKIEVWRRSYAVSENWKDHVIVVTNV